MTDPFGVLSVRAARRYRWRLAGGRLTADGDGLRFVANRLERLRADTSWECPANDVAGVRVSGKIWLVVESSGGTERFRVFGAAAVAPELDRALHPAATAAPRP